MTDRNEYFMQLALKEAECAYQENEIPVGAVIVKDNTVIASAHNKKESSSDPTAHAELLVIRDAAAKTGSWRLTDCTLYVTKEPCIMCAGAMLNARLNKLVLGCIDERYGAVMSRYQLTHDPFLNHQVTVEAGILKHESENLLKKFFALRR